MKSEIKGTLQFSIAIGIILLSAVCFGSVQPHLKSIGQLLALILLVYLLKSSRTVNEHQIPKPLIPIAIFLLYGSVLVFIAPHRVTAIENILMAYQIFIILLFMLHSIQRNWSERIWINAIISLGIVFSLIEIGLFGLWLVQKSQFVPVNLDNLIVGYRATGTLLGHPNVFSGFLNIAILLSINALSIKHVYKNRVILIVIIALLLFTNYLTSSRSGWISLVIGLTTFIVFHVCSKLSEIQRWFAGKDPMLRASIVLSLVVVSLISAFGFIWLILIQQQISPGHAPILSARQGIWQPAATIFLKSPIVGNGPGSFTMLYAAEIKSPPGFSTSHAHNIFLQIGAEYGLIGLMIVVFGIIMFLNELVNAWRCSNQKLLSELAVIAAIFSAFLIHHFADYLLESPLYLLVVLYILTMAMSSRLGKRGYIYYKNPEVSTFLGLVGAVLVIGALYSSRGSFSYWNGVVKHRDGMKAEGEAQLCGAYSVQPEHNLYAVQCGLAKIHSTYPSVNRNILIDAEALFRESAINPPAWPIHLANLAMIEWELGEYQSAISTLENASELAPRNALLLLNLGWMYEEQGQIEQAYDSYKLALTYDPWLSETMFFSSSNVRSEISRTMTFETVLPRVSLDVWMGYEAIKDGNLDLARSHFYDAIGQSELNSAPYAGLAELSLLEGNLEVASKHIDLALFMNRGWPRYRMLDLKARILYKLSENNEAEQFMSAAFNAVINDSVSETYYSRSFRRYYIEPDKIPYLLRGYLTEDMAIRLRTLAGKIEVTDPLLANQILSVIDQELN